MHFKIGEEARVIACWRLTCGEFDIAPWKARVVLGMIDEEGVVHRLNRVLSGHDHCVFCARELEAQYLFPRTMHALVLYHDAGLDVVVKVDDAIA